MNISTAERTELLRTEAARRPHGGERSVANLLAVLFERVSNPRTGELWTESEVAEATVDDLNGCQRLSAERIRAIRRRKKDGVSFDDLMLLSAVFKVNPDYFKPKVDPSCLPPDLSEARRAFSARKDADPAERIAEDLSRILAATPHPNGGLWTPERVEESTGGGIKGAFLRGLLEARIAAPDPSRVVLVAEVIGFDAMLFWERNLGPLAVNSLLL